MNSQLKDLLARQAALNRTRQPNRPPTAPRPGTQESAEADDTLVEPVAPPPAANRMVPPLPEIVKTIVENIPAAIYADERILYLAEQVEVLAEKDAVALRLHVEHFLQHMLDIGASDIDLGVETMCITCE